MLNMRLFHAEVTIFTCLGRCVDTKSNLAKPVLGQDANHVPVISTCLSQHSSFRKLLYTPVASDYQDDRAGQ
jgi:hypothetical protein